MTRKIALSLFALILGISFARPSRAEFPLTPETLPGGTVATAEQVKALQAKGGKVFDVRKKAEYAEGHVPGAVFLSYTDNSDKSVDFDAKADAFDMSGLPADKAVPIAFYCNGNRCWKSYKAAVQAIRAGHKSVHWFREGLPGWKEKGLPLE